MPIVGSEGNRWSLYPLHHQDVMEKVKAAQAATWFPDEIDLSKDRTGFEQLNDNQKHFILMVLAFFANSDGLVTENLALNFYEAIEIAEIRYYYSHQIFMEAVHSETYSLLIDAYIQNQDEKNKLFDAYNNFPTVAQKLKWAEKWMLSRPQSLTELLKTLVAFIAVEGISFSSSFCAIYWCKEQGFDLPGLYQSNEMISRDELSHSLFGVLVYNKLTEDTNGLSEEEIISIIQGCVNVEIDFCRDSLPVSLLGMNSSNMIQYIKHIADGYLKMLIGRPIYNAENPFQFMEKLNLDTKNDFFTSKVTNYQRPDIVGGHDELVFTLE
jgi:ribonucleoside-diphosphate reductase beta chain